jgi:phthalate 4,5-dioxygenase
MLSIEENERITQTGPGTPMGNLFRRFWLPVLLSSELVRPDDPPVRVQVLSERLIAFRDSDGRIGLLEERCPHRHASLYWGRNEECGLRCAYHGWKFTVDGTCVDAPAEPAESRLKDAIQATAYATHEAGGVIWAYMGPPDKQPPFPDFEWALLPDTHYRVSKRLQQCNYLQNLEGELDTSHVNFLHRSWKEGGSVMPPADLARKRYLLAETDFGLLCLARSDSGPDDYYWRMTPFLLPTFTHPPVGFNSFLAAMPRNDESMWGFAVSWNPERPLRDDDTRGSATTLKVDPNTFIPEANISNDYLRDLDRLRTESFTGIRLIKEQDMAVQEDQDGPLMRRHEEHLGVTDRAIVGARRLLLRLADDLERGIDPPHVQHPESYRLHSLQITAPRGKSPVDLWTQAQPTPAIFAGVGAPE